MRQRNPNQYRQQKQSNNNPFNTVNPYRVKAKFYSQKKPLSQSNSITAASSNPQSLRYSRNYKESPASFYSQQQRNNCMLVRDNSKITKTLKHLQQQLKEQDYQLRLKQFVADKLCPADPYLQIVKDKFVYISNQGNSEFQKAMKMSNLSISGIVVNKNNTYSQTGAHKQNPFYRKNLISPTTPTTTNSQPYQSSWHYSKLNYNIDNSYGSVGYSYPMNNEGIYNCVSNTSKYQYSAINPIDISIPNQYPRDSIYRERRSSISDNIMERIINKLQNHREHNNRCGKQSPKSMSASFGPDYDWKDNTNMHQFVNAVIEQSKQPYFNIESQAPHRIKVKEKTFFLNKVSRIIS